MAEWRKWTELDKQRNQRLLDETKRELIKIASEFDASILGKAHTEGVPNQERYEMIRLLRQIEGLQNILVYRGQPQPATCLPFLAKSAEEWVKEHGVMHG